MANEFLIKKWKMWFKVLDRKHAGQLTQEDEKRDEETYLKNFHLEGERYNESLKSLHSYWDKFVFHGKQGPVTEEQFIDMTKDDFKSDKQGFVENITKACADDLKVIDGDGKGYITEDEYIIANASIGLDDKEWSKMNFKVFNPVDGKVSTGVIRDTWVKFFVNEDSSEKDALFDCFEKYPNL